MEQERAFKGIWIPKEIWLSQDLTMQEKIMLVEIDSLDNESGCFATNKYLADFFGISKTRVSIVLNNLIEKGYLSSKIIYKEGTKQILNRVLNICRPPYPTNVKEGYITKVKDPIQQKLKDNNIDYNKDINNTIENNKLNEFNLYNNFDENEQCDCMSKSTKQRCSRKSSYNINGKNYCNQHSRAILSKMLGKNSVFQKPTVEEINQYCTERKNNVDPQRFFDFYESKGWKVGKEPMKDWKACIRTWEKNNTTNQPVQRNTGNVFFNILREEGKMK